MTCQIVGATGNLSGKRFARKERPKMKGKYWLLWVALALLSTSCTSIHCGISRSTLNRYVPDHTLVKLMDLNKDVQEYLRETYHDSQPGCIKGDFDGDGIADYALLLSKTEGKIGVRLVVLKGKSSNDFVPFELDEFDERIKDIFLRPIPPGKIVNWDRTQTVSIDRPGFELVIFESASYVYFWKDGRFGFIQTSE